jgi:hypothetical protein
VIKFTAEVLREFLDPLQILEQLFVEHALAHTIDAHRNGRSQIGKLTGLTSQRGDFGGLLLWIWWRKIPFVLSLQLLRMAQARRDLAEILGWTQQPERKHTERNKAGELHAPLLTVRAGLYPGTKKSAHEFFIGWQESWSKRG